MKIEKIYLLIGIGVGLISSFFCFQYFAPRYELQKTGLNMVKVDKWTGRSWRFSDNNWRAMITIDENTKEVDKTLTEALNLPYVKDNSEIAMTLLKNKYDVLKGLTDDELMERIKFVYSRQVLCSLYLDNYLKVHQTGNKPNAMPVIK